MKTLALIVLTAAPAMAADDPVQRACQADYVKLCHGGAAGGVGATACLRQNYVGLSHQCRQALDAARKAKPEDR